MERDGLVERVNCEVDRRVRRVRLTEKGREFAPKVISEHRAFLHQMMVSCLPPENHQTLITLLNQIKESIINLDKNFNTKRRSLYPQHPDQKGKVPTG
jgi:DNA-binding MarR family transcriptional regulator